MHPADIKAELQKKGHPSIRVAERLKVPASTVSQVINGHSSSRKVARYISGVTGIPVSELWPNRYPHLELEELRRRAAA